MFGHRTIRRKLFIRQDLFQETSEWAADLAPDFENTPLSYNNQKNGGEITIAGVNKAIGMREFLKAAQVSVVNSVAVGDGPNDFEMIEFAGTGIAMGNAIPDLKDKADMVTTDINNDGIYNAFEKLGLLFKKYIVKSAKTKRKIQENLWKILKIFSNLNFLVYKIKKSK